MLRKLCKYELMASGRIYLVGFAAILVSALAMGLMCFTNLVQGMAGAVVAIVYFMVIWTMLVLSLVQAISRFNKNLLKGEGYLMHTLPVPTWQLILSKLLSGLLLMVATVAVAAISVGILVGLITLAEGGLSMFLDMLSKLGQVFVEFQFYNGMPGWLTILWICVISLLGYANFLLMTYAGMAVGQLFTRWRDGIAVVVFFALAVVEELIATGGVRLISIIPAEENLMNHMPEALAYGGATLWLLLLGVFHFFLAERLLSKRLNLE